MHHNGPSVCKTNAVLLRLYNDTSYSHLITSTTTLSKKATRKAKVSSTAKRAAEETSTSDDAIAVQAKSKKTPRPTEDDDDVYTTESTDVFDVEVKEKEPKKSKTSFIETKTIDALKNAYTSVIFMNFGCGVGPVDTKVYPVELINGEEDELLYTIKCDKETNKPIISLLHSTGTSDTALMSTLKCLIKEFEGENIVSIPIEQDNTIPIDIEKVKASTDMPIHSDNNNLNNGSFHFRKLTDTQKRYSIGDIEFLSIIDSLKKFQHLLIGKKSNDKQFTKRQDNYVKYIKEFDYELRHISGKNNGIADFLSRKYDNFQWDESFLNKIKEEQINSEWLLEMKKNPNLSIEEINDICYLSEHGFKELIIVDKETFHTVIREYHDTKYSGHHALDITYNNVRQDYYFKKMFSIINRYIKSCATCQLNINRKDNGILQSLEIPFEVWRDISIDFLSLPKTTYALNGFTVEVDQVCVIVCILSKMLYIVPCHKTIDAQHTAQLLLNHVFRLLGYPRTIVSDRDPIFLSDIWGRWAKTIDSKLKMTVAHRAQADGQTERMNREIKRILTKASTEYGENWSDIITLIEFAMNSSMSRGYVIFVVGEKVMVKRKFFQTNLSKDLISHKLQYKNCGPFMITAIHGNNVTLDLVCYPNSAISVLQTL
ncbi:hypothetical protein ACTFIW_005446 [Dictyostelium discoideum]